MQSGDKTIERVYNYLCDYISKNQISPSVRDICAGVGLILAADGGFRRIIARKSTDYQPIALRTVALDAQVGIVGHRVHGHALGIANYASGAQLFRIAVKDDFAIAVSESEVADTDSICIAEKAGVRLVLGIYPPVDAVDTVSHSINIAA